MSQQDTDLITKKMFELVKEANRLMREQSAERFNQLKHIAMNTQGIYPEISKLMLDEINNLHSDSNVLLSQLKVLYEHNPAQNLYLEHILGYKPDGEEEEDPKIVLAKEVIRLEASIVAREELIEILKEDLELGRASRTRIINDIYELRSQYDKVKADVEMLEKILLFNPRFKVIEVLNKYPDGVTVRQLASLLDRRDEEIEEIIRDLETNSYIERSGNMIRQLART